MARCALIRITPASKEGPSGCDRTHNGLSTPPFHHTGSRCPPALSSRSPRPWLWWLALAAIWIAGTLADQLWLQLDQRLPAWDQADYLNSAVDHGRALGLLPGGGWPGWQGLLDLSPKIPPLASLVNGSVMALSGQAPDQASAALAVWQALLLVSVACWGRELQGPGFALLAAALTTMAPGLIAVRLDYTLDLPLTATAVLALWLLGRWQGAAGGRWSQAIVAALAVAAAVLVKQSALLVLLAPCLWAAGLGLRRRGRRLQVLVALGLVLGLVLPWLHHNWITTIGGTNRAVIESAGEEGDPGILSLEGLLWYPRLWPAQLGPLNLTLGLGGGVLALARGRIRTALEARGRASDTAGAKAGADGWRWLIGCALAGWLLTSVSPNKDARYITPVLPLLLLLLARGWWELGRLLRRRLGRRAATGLLGAALLASAGLSAAGQAGELHRERRSPLPELIGELRGRLGQRPETLVVLPNAAEVNEHTATVYGRMGGGELLGRQLGRREEEHPLVLERSRWVLLTGGEAGMRREASRLLAQRVRSDPRFVLRGTWTWPDGAPLELWERRDPPDPAGDFSTTFPALARGLERGPSGLAPGFAAIGPEHQLDGHRSYQARVHHWAERRLQANPADREALWSLALLATLRNRPAEAERWFARLEALLPHNPWPSAYRAVVLLAGWQPWQARSVAEGALRRRPDPVLQGLADLSAVLGADPRRLGPALRSVPEATEAVRRDLAGSRPAAGS